MSIASLMVDDVTVVRAAVTQDRYGNTEKDWGRAVRVTVKGWVAQRHSHEVLNGREAELSTWVAYLPADTAIAGTDRVEWRGITFEVSGPPNPARTPRGPHHLEATLVVVEG